MKTSVKILMLFSAFAFIACGEVAESMNMAVSGSILESLDGKKEDLMSYGSISEKAFYVSEDDQKLAISRLKGELIDSATVVFKVDNEKIKFRIAPMVTLDFNKNLKAGDFGTHKNMVCTALTNVGGCVNMDDTITGKFMFSMKIPKGGLSYCAPQANERCDFVWVKYTGATWNKKDCKGNPAGNQLLRICYDNNS